MKRLLALGCAVAFVTACSSVTPPTPGASQTTPANTSGESPSAGPALSGSLTIWDTYTADTPGVSRGAPTALTAALDVVRMQNPGLTLTITQVSLSDLFISLQLQGPGGVPDLVLAPNDNLGDLARAGVIADLSSAFTPDELAHFSDLAQGGSMVDGKLMQVPSTMRTVGIYYDSAKIAAFPNSTDDLRTAVHDGDVKLGILQGIYQVFGFWGSFGGQLLDESGKCIASSTGVADAFAYYHALRDAGARWYGATAYDQMVADFKSGTIDAVIDGPWAVDAYRDALPASLAVAPLPAGPGGSAAPLIGVDGWTVNSHSANSALAIAFAKRMAQPDILGIFADQATQVPADPSVAPTDPVAAQFAAAAESGVVRPQVIQLAQFWGKFGQALDDVIDNNTDPAQAVSTACSDMNSANGL